MRTLFTRSFMCYISLWDTLKTMHTLAIHSYFFVFPLPNLFFNVLVLFFWFFFHFVDVLFLVLFFVVRFFILYMCIDLEMYAGERWSEDEFSYLASVLLGGEAPETRVCAVRCKGFSRNLFCKKS